MYYTIDLSSDVNVIGSQYPQVQKMKSGYDYEGCYSVYKLGRIYDRLLDFTPDLDGFVLHSRAKPTDFLSNVFTGPRGFIISEKVKSILENCKLPLHTFYPITVNYRKGTLDNYYWFHIICEDLPNIVDYPSSTFYIQKFDTDLGEISILSKEDFFKRRTDIKDRNPGHNISIWAKKIKFIHRVEYDFFFVSRIDFFDYISERLHIQFLKEKVTGITTRPLLYNFY